MVAPPRRALGSGGVALRGRTGRTLGESALERRAKKWAPVFSFKRCDNKNLEPVARFRFRATGASGPILTFASAIGRIVCKCQNLQGPLETCDSSGFCDFDICDRPIRLAGCKCQNQSSSGGARRAQMPFMSAHISPVYRPDRGWGTS